MCEKNYQDINAETIDRWIEEGWEWFAFTFNDQEQISLSKEEIEEIHRMIDASREG